MEQRDTFLVCSPVTWVADEFREAAESLGMGFEHSLGLDLPRTPPERIAGAWMPAEHAVRLLLAGYPLPFSAPGPLWLPSLPIEQTGRVIKAMRKKNARPLTGFWKVAEAKHPQFEPLYRSSTQAAEDLARLDDDTWLQYTETILDIATEDRFFVTHDEQGNISLSGSTYKEGEWIFYSDLEVRQTPGAENFAYQVASSSPAPYGYALDIATLSSGQHVVLEANPAWCSAAYGARLDDVIASIRASMSGKSERFNWQPDPYLVRSAQRKRLLL